MDFNNLPTPEGTATPPSGIQTTNRREYTPGSNIVSEFFSENVTYIDLEGTELDDLYTKLDHIKYRANLAVNMPGIEHLEKNKDYIKFERSVIISNKIIKFEEGMEKEDSYHKLTKCTFYIFEDFACATGDAKAIKDTNEFLSDIMMIQLVPYIPTEITMLKLPDRFHTIENITVDRVKHNSIKKLTISGKATDVADLDITFPGYDVAAISGVINTNTDERRIKITKTGKISFYKLKDKPLYIEHLKFGFNLISGE